jgi:DNA-binding NarL/FixJ family response regulator
MKVVLAGRSYVCRQGIKQILGEIGYQLLSECDNFDQVTKLSGQYHPDLIMLEVGAPESENLSIIGSLKTKSQKSKIMLFCENGMSGNTFHSIQSKVDCVVNMTASKEEIILALNSLLSGEKYFTPSVIKLLLQQNENKTEQPLSKLFTDREHQVIQYILKGRSNEQIADILFLSEKTVATHKRNIMKKAQVKKTSDLILFALNKGLGKDSPL